MSAIGTRAWPSALVNTTQQIGGSLGTALLNTLAATATASYIVAHGAAATQAGVVHGFAVAFAVGAGFLALGAVVSAVLHLRRAGRGRARRRAWSPAERADDP